MNCLNYYFTAWNLNIKYIAISTVSSHWRSWHFSSITKTDSICSELLLWILRIFWRFFGQKRQLPDVHCWTFPQNTAPSSCRPWCGRAYSSLFPETAAVYDQNSYSLHFFPIKMPFPKNRAGGEEGWGEEKKLKKDKKKRKRDTTQPPHCINIKLLLNYFHSQQLFLVDTATYFGSIGTYRCLGRRRYIQPMTWFLRAELPQCQGALSNCFFPGSLCLDFKYQSDSLQALQFNSKYKSFHKFHILEGKTEG